MGRTEAARCMTGMVASLPLPREGRAFHAAGWSIACGVFFAAWISWRPMEELFTLSDGFFCLGLVLLMVAGRLPIFPFGPLTGPWLIALILMLGGLFASSIVNGDPLRWLVVALQYCFAVVILPMLLIQQEDGMQDRLALAHILGVATMELFGALVYYFADGGFWELRARFGHEFITGARRLGAFLGDANWNAAVIGMTLPFVVHLMVRGVLRLVPGIILLVILVQGLLLTASFSGFVSTLVALLVYALVAGVLPNMRSMMLGGVALGIYVLSGAPLPAAFSKRVAPALSSGDVSAAGTFVGRWELTLEAWAMTSETSILGLGVDQYRVVSSHGAPVHNIFLLIWTEGGLPALVGWLSLLLIMIAVGVVAVRSDRRAAALSLSLILVFLIQASANPHMYARMWMVPVMLAAGYAMRAGRSAPARPRTTFPMETKP